MGNSPEKKGFKAISGFILALSFLLLSPAHADQEAPRDVDQPLLVDCLLPGQIRSLGRVATYITQKRTIKTTVRDCKIRGGEYSAS